MAKPRIITHHEYPPIPIRSFDWCAYRDGREEEGNYGWGPTKEAAIADLLANEEDVDTTIERCWPRCAVCGKPADLQNSDGRDICVECMFDEAAPDILNDPDHDLNARKHVEGETE